MVTSINVGLGASLGFAKESAWGTHTAPTRWCEFTSETIEWKPKRIVGKGLAFGNVVQRSSTRCTVSSTVEGDIKTPLYFKGMGLLLGSLMGSLTTGAPSGNVQTHALGLSPPGHSLTIQKGVPQASDGLIKPYSYQGCKVTKGVFEFAPDDFVQATFSIDGRTFDQGINSFTTPSYQAANGIHCFDNATLLIGAVGAEAPIEGVRKATLTIERPYRVDNFYLDGTGLKQEQTQNEFTKVTLDLETDYWTDASFAAQFAADTQASIIIQSVGPFISGTSGPRFGFQAAMPSLRWESGPPMVSGPDLVQPKMQLIGLLDDVHVPCTLTYTSSDTAL